MKPEFLRIADVVKVFGLSRAKIYDLINTGEIRSVALCDKGKGRGVRLIPYGEMKAFLEAKLHRRREQQD